MDLSLNIFSRTNSVWMQWAGGDFLGKQEQDIGSPITTLNFLLSSSRKKKLVGPSSASMKSLRSRESRIRSVWSSSCARMPVFFMGAFVVGSFNFL